MCYAEFNQKIEAEKTKAYNQGFAAFQNGWSEDHNPYEPEYGYETLYPHWEEGYIDAEIGAEPEIRLALA